MVGTPIGNLGDMSPRVAEAFRAADGRTPTAASPGPPSPAGRRPPARPPAGAGRPRPEGPAFGAPGPAPETDTGTACTAPPPWSGASGSKAASPQACVSSRVYHIIVYVTLKRTPGRAVGAVRTASQSRTTRAPACAQSSGCRPPPLSRASRRPRAPSPTAPPPGSLSGRLRAHG